MPRKARLDAPGTMHHVIVRGLEGVPIFLTDHDRENILGRVAQISKLTGCRILAWSLLNTHMHLLILSGPAGLSTFMQRLLTGYAVWFNKRHERKGHLFQNRYKSIVCETEPYLLELVRYIHLNPLRASAVQDLKELDGYPWSGHSFLIGRRRNDWQELDYVLRQFAPTKRKAIRVYQQFMKEGKSLGQRPDLVGGGLIRSMGGWSQVLSLREKGVRVDHDPRILGNGEFVQAIMKEADEKLARQIKGRRNKEAVQETVKGLCIALGIEEKELRGGGQRRKVCAARAEIAFVLCREMGITMAEAARSLGVNSTAIAMAIKKRERTKEKL